MQLSYLPKSQTGSATERVNLLLHQERDKAWEWYSKKRNSWSYLGICFCCPFCYTLIIMKVLLAVSCHGFSCAKVYIFQLPAAVIWNHWCAKMPTAGYTVIIVRHTERINAAHSRWKSVIFSSLSGLSAHIIFHNIIKGKKERKAPPLWFGLSACLYVCCCMFHRRVEVSADKLGRESERERVKRS